MGLLSRPYGTELIRPTESQHWKCWATIDRPCGTKKRLCPKVVVVRFRLKREYGNNGTNGTVCALSVCSVIFVCSVFSLHLRCGKVEVTVVKNLNPTGGSRWIVQTRPTERKTTIRRPPADRSAQPTAKEVGIEQSTSCRWWDYKRLSSLQIDGRHNSKLSATESLHLRYLTNLSDMVISYFKIEGE
jgi:hypothetical protein